MAKTSPLAPLRARKPRLTRDEQREQRKQQLLAAAWEMFCAKGYEAVTIDHVAERAGYSRMPVYTLFGDKQTLFFELWQSVTGAIERQLFGGFPAGAPLRQNLGRLAEILTRPLADGYSLNGESLFFVVQTIALSRPDIARRLEQLAKKVVEDVAAFVRQSTLGRGERLRASPETVAAHLVAHINGMATVQFQTQQRFARAADLEPIFHAIAFKS